MDFMNKDFNGYEVTGHKFEIYGRCPKCSKSSSVIELTSFCIKKVAHKYCGQPSLLFLFFSFSRSAAISAAITSISF